LSGGCVWFGVVVVVDDVVVDDVVVDVLGVTAVVVGLFDVGGIFWVEAPAKTRATGVATAANSRRLPAARAR
jgi:uncharacterized membrane protein HdeD (DUF308 family)